MTVISWVVKSYIARHNEAGRLIFKAITKGTSGNNGFIADLGTQENMQAMDLGFASLAGSRDHPLGMHQGGEEKVQDK